MPTPGRVTLCQGDGCGRPIRWLFTEGGRRLPVDPEPHPAGTVVLVTTDGRTLARVLTGAQLPAQEAAYRPHWVTCPASESFRGRQSQRAPRCARCRDRMDPWLTEHGYDAHIGCLPPISLAEAVAAERRRLEAAA